MKDKYILVTAISLNRVESRYKKAYCYKAVALRKALEKSLKLWQGYVAALKDAKHYGYKHLPKEIEAILVLSEREYAQRIDAMGEWKEPLVGGTGKKVWIAKDTPACCDVSTETYWSM